MKIPGRPAGRMFATARLTRLLTRIARGPRDGARLSARVVEQRGSTVDDCRSSFDVYRPARRSRRTTIALHGVTLHGGRDRRLVHFARCLAEAGVTCVVPSLSHLSDGRWHPGDIDDIDLLVRYVGDRYDSKVGLVGFSYGASYGLVSAARPETASRIDSVLAFGAYHSLADLLSAYGSRAEPTGGKELEDYIFMRLILAHQNPDQLPQLEPARADIRPLLLRYCQEATHQEKTRFYARYLTDLDTAQLLEQSAPPETLNRLSPQGQLAGLQCPVHLIHDSGDNLVPGSQAERLYRDLRRDAPGLDHRLLVTALLSHVTPSGLLKAGELRGLYRALGPLI